MEIIKMLETKRYIKIKTNNNKLSLEKKKIGIVS